MSPLNDTRFTPASRLSETSGSRMPDFFKSISAAATQILVKYDSALARKGRQFVEFGLSRESGNRKLLGCTRISTRVRGPMAFR